MVGKNERKHKVFENFYINKKGEITEHKSARGGIYNIRMPNWKSIKQCENPDEIRILIGKFKSEMKNLDKVKDSKMITEWRTAIKMAGDYYDVLSLLEETDEDKYTTKISPLTNTVEELDEFGEIIKSEDEEGSALEKEIPDDEIVTTKKVKRGIERIRKKVDVSTPGYVQKGKIIGYVPYYHKQVQTRVQEILDNDLKNMRALLKIKPDLRKRYKNWFYTRMKKK